MKSVVLAAAFAAAVVSGSAFAEEPAHYVEWIQSSGSKEYIVLPVMGQANLKYEIKVRRVTQNNTDGLTILGCQDLQKGLYCVPIAQAFTRRWAYQYGNATYVKCAGGKSDSNAEPGIANTYVLKLTMVDGKQEFYQNDVLYNNNGAGTVAAFEDLDVPLTLFARYSKDANGNLSAVNHDMKVRIWYLKIWDADDKLLFDGKPCCLSDGTFALYDTVSKSCYGNSGAGALSGGPKYDPESGEITGCQLVLKDAANGSYTTDPEPDVDGYYPVGATVKVTAVPDAGYGFAKWNINVCSGSNWAEDCGGSKYDAEQEIVMNTTRTLQATFAADPGEPIVRFAAPTAVGTKKGTDWANAGDLATMIETVGMNPQGGEVRLQKGVYRPKATIELMKNIKIIGGYDGESEDEEPAPERNQTILNGSDGSVMWAVGDLVKNGGTATTVPVVDVTEGKLNLPPEGYPQSTVWFPSVAGDSFGFIKSVGHAENVTVANLSFASAQVAAISFSTTQADGLLVTNCTFAACEANSRNPTVLLGNSSGEIVDCKFYGNAMPLDIAGASRTCEVTVRNCLFKQNRHQHSTYDSRYSSGISFRDNANATVDSCLFVSNVASSTASQSYSTCFFLASGAARNIKIRNSVFRDNYCANNGIGVGRLYSSTGRLTIDGCQFVGNVGGTCFLKDANTYLQVKNCYIASNSCDRPTVGASTYKSSVFTAITSHRYSTEFVNCTVENNLVRGSTVGRSCHTMITQSDRPTNLAIVNCLFRNNDCFQSVDGADVRCDEIHWYINGYQSQNAAAYVNSIFMHTASDYVSINYEGYANLSIYANSYFQGLDLSDKTSGGQGWISDVLTDVERAPGLAADYKYTAAGTPTLGIAADSPIRKRGIKIYEGKDGNCYLYNAAKGTPQKGKTLWQALHTDYNAANYYLTAEQVEEQGLSLDNPVIADALGMERRCKKVSPGPVDFPAPGLMLLVR